MTLPDLLGRLDALGVDLEVSGDRLRYTAPAGVLSSDLRDAIRTNRAALLACLGGRDATPPAADLPTPRPGSWSEIDLILPPDWPLATQGAEGKDWRRLPDGRIVATFTPAGLEWAIVLSETLATTATTATPNGDMRP